MNAKMAELSARHKITLDCISKLIQSATFYPSRNWDDLYRRTERIRDLLIIAYDEAEAIEVEVHAMSEPEPESPKENAPEPTAIGTSAEKNKTQVKDTPDKPQDARLEVTRMLKAGMPVKDIAKKVGKSEAWVYKLRAEVM